jgi:hypothetical protein
MQAEIERLKKEMATVAKAKARALIEEAIDILNEAGTEVRLNSYMGGDMPLDSDTFYWGE